MQLPARATIEGATTLIAQLDAALAAAAGGALRIDAAALKDFDTSAVALLLHVRRGARERQIQLIVDNAPPKLRELARLYGVEELLSLAT